MSSPSHNTFSIPFYNTVDRFVGSAEGSELVKQALSACSNGSQDVLMNILYNNVKNVYAQESNGAKSCHPVRLEALIYLVFNFD